MLSGHVRSNGTCPHKINITLRVKDIVKRNLWNKAPLEVKIGITTHTQSPVRRTAITAVKSESVIAFIQLWTPKEMKILMKVYTTRFSYEILCKG